MFKRLLRGLLTLVLLVVMGLLSTIEIFIEVVHQIVRLFKRGFGYISEEFLKWLASIYKGKPKLKMNRKQVKETNDIRFYEFDYDED